VALVPFHLHASGGGNDCIADKHRHSPSAHLCFFFSSTGAASSNLPRLPLRPRRRTVATKLSSVAKGCGPKRKPLTCINNQSCKWVAGFGK